MESKSPAKKPLFTSGTQRPLFSLVRSHCFLSSTVVGSHYFSGSVLVGSYDLTSTTLFGSIKKKEISLLIFTDLGLSVIYKIEHKYDFFFFLSFLYIVNKYIK
jgi:hypothetical protein